MESRGIRRKNPLGEDVNIVTNYITLLHSEEVAFMQLPNLTTIRCLWVFSSLNVRPYSDNSIKQEEVVG